MNKKPALDMDKIARTLGAERRGKVHSSSGYFGAVQLAAEVQERFRAPPRGGRSTDPSWTERRLMPLTSTTLDRLVHLSEALQERGVTISPLQVAALLLEHAVDHIDSEEIANLAQQRAS